MKKFYYTFIALLLACGIHAQKTTRSLGQYNAVKVSGGIELILHDGQPKAEIEVRKGKLEDLKTELKKGTLHVKFEKKSWGWGSGSRKAVVDLYGAQSLNSIEVSAGADLRAELELRASEMELDASSGASMQLSLNNDLVGAQASSGGAIEIEGETGKIKLEASSGATIKANKLRSDEAFADASSGALIKLWAENYLQAEASSGGSVRYKGNPETDINVGKYSGGKVSKL